MTKARKASISIAVASCALVFAGIVSYAWPWSDTTALIRAGACVGFLSIFVSTMLWDAG